MVCIEEIVHDYWWNLYTKFVVILGKAIRVDQRVAFSQSGCKFGADLTISS